MELEEPKIAKLIDRRRKCDLLQLQMLGDADGNILLDLCRNQIYHAVNTKEALLAKRIFFKQTCRVKNRNRCDVDGLAWKRSND